MFYKNNAEHFFLFLSFFYFILPNLIFFLVLLTLSYVYNPLCNARSSDHFQKKVYDGD